MAWDDYYTLDDFKNNRITPSKTLIDMLPLLNLKRGANILDVGCGFGINARYLASLPVGYKVYATGAPESIVNNIQPELERCGVKYNDVSFVPASSGDINLRSSGFNDSSMDFIVCDHFLEFVDETKIDLVVAECARVLKPQSPMFLRVVSTDHPYYSVPNYGPGSNISKLSLIGNKLLNDKSVFFFNDYELKGLMYNSFTYVGIKPVVSEGRYNASKVTSAEWVVLAYKK